MCFTDVFQIRFAFFNFTKIGQKKLSTPKSSVTITTNTLHKIRRLIGKFIHNQNRFPSLHLEELCEKKCRRYFFS